MKNTTNKPAMCLLLLISVFFTTCKNPFIERLWKETPVITTVFLPDGAVGEPYSLQLAANGSGNVSWELTNGNLPEGLTLSAGGSGVYSSPSDSGQYCAAWRAASYDGGGKYDWFLPNSGEMTTLLRNRSLMGSYAPALDQYYWASSGYNYNAYDRPWPENFADREAHVLRVNSGGTVDKVLRKIGESYPIIPIRAF